MLRELRTYHRPKELREALALLGNAQVKTAPLAGGSELLGRQDTEIEAIVDLQDLPLDYVMSADEVLFSGLRATAVIGMSCTCGAPAITPTSWFPLPSR